MRRSFRNSLGFETGLVHIKRRSLQGETAVCFANNNASFLFLFLAEISRIACSFSVSVYSDQLGILPMVPSEFRMMGPKPSNLLTYAVSSEPASVSVNNAKLSTATSGSSSPFPTETRSVQWDAPESSHFSSSPRAGSALFIILINL